MIAAFQSYKTQIPPVLLRGKDYGFWAQALYSNWQWLDQVHNNSQNQSEFQFLLVFNPNTFLQMADDTITELENFLHHIPITEREDIIITLPGLPFLAVPTPFLKKYPPTCSDDALFSKLAESKQVKPITLQTTYSIFDVKKDFRLIENFITDFQVASYIKSEVSLEDFNHFYIEGLIPIGRGTKIASGAILKGKTRIGENSMISAHVFIENSIIGDNCTVLPGCIITDSCLENKTQVGPYTHLRNHALVKEGAKMGNFVEMKKSTLGKGSKAMHLSYIGDAEVGEKVNIGAGTITCNYDGVNKNKTIIEDNVFIGSGTELVAPVTVRQNSYVGAGSTITEEVPPDSLALARQRQKNLLGWVKRKKLK